MKLKICSSCGIECYLWKRLPKLCKSCALKLKSTSIGSFKLTTKTPNKATAVIKKKKSISPISNSRKEALKHYRRLRDKYFLEHPVCEFPECNSKDITLHHMRGRIGAFLTDKRYFKSLCMKHHRFIEENPSEAIKLGLSQKRLDK